jgi:hypothetical protein
MGGVPDYAAMERYLGRCLGLVIRLDGVLPSDSLNLAQELMEHGEPAEGVLQLAWALVETGAQVPSDIVSDIRELTAELIVEEHMPAGLDDCALDG